MITSSLGAYAATPDLSTAIQNAKVACSGIDDSMAHLKTMAGVNTAVTAVGTVAGGVALGTGIAKKNVDKEYQAELNELRAKKFNVPIELLEFEDKVKFNQDIENGIKQVFNDLSQEEKRIAELEKKSKTLGNVRTGTLAVSTVTNVAGTAIAATNKVDGSLEEKINKCLSSIKELSDAKLAAKVEGSAKDTEINQADKIINACRDYEYIDIKSINKRATGAAVAAGIGVGTGVVGTITSAVANTDKTRQGEEQKEKNLNTMSNVMAGASTAASATATVFNATQISAIKKATTVAEACEGALK